jgi:O-antigen biosynthesis protein WbqP
MKRIFDLTLALLAILVCLPLFILIAVAIKATSPGPVLYWSTRVGQDNKTFKMPKFRTMRLDAPTVASRHMAHPEQYLTPVGSFLRLTSLDELPQLFCILKGEMSFVGPRPVLTNETDLLFLRTQEGVHHATPGLTGWAQVNGRDMMSIEEKVAYEREYLKRRSFGFDLYILLLTIPGVLSKRGVSH